MSQASKFDEILQRLGKLDTIDTKLDDLNGQVKIITDTVSNLQHEVKSNRSDIEDLRDELENFKRDTKYEVKNIKTNLNTREQQLRSTTVRIFNFPIMKDEAVDNYKGLSQRVYDRILRPLMTAGKNAGDLATVPQIQNTTEACYRIFTQREPEPGKPPPPVIVRLVSKAIKTAVLKQRRLHMPAPSAGEKELGAKRFVIVEDLTPPTYSLLKMLQADERTEKVWTVNGQIHYSRPKTLGYKKVKNVFDTVDSILE